MQDAWIRSRLNGPGIALMGTGGLGLLVQAGAAVVQVSQLALAAAVVVDQGGPEATRLVVSSAVALTFVALSCVVGVVLIYGGWAMTQGRSWTAAVVASGLAMVPFCSPCCLLGLPAGIWALMVLLDAEVKAAYAAAEEEDAAVPRSY